jgi:hypothetical protein
MTLLGILCSLLSRYLNKQFINHTVHAMQGDVSEIPIPDLDEATTEALEGPVSEVVKKQKGDPRYRYHLHEQKEIDRVVYELYRLNEEDVREVELWYCRRYPRLTEAQGVMAEVNEKYKDHLARAKRILEKPPAYWRSHPILTLIAQDEGPRLEFKETLEADTLTGAKFPTLVHSVLKTLAAFLNTEGGTLLIGVSNTGEIKGLQRDLDLFGKAKANYDNFQLKLRALFHDRLDPKPLGKININLEHLPEGDVCRIDVEPQTDITHLDGKEVYVRDGNRTKQLEGPTLTRWILERGPR